MTAVRNLLFTWFPVFGSIPAWTVHLLAIAALTRYSCNVPSSRWTFHVITAVTLAMAAAATAMSARMVAAGGDEASPEGPGRLAFLGRLGLLIGATDVLLIVLEEVYVLGLTGHSCG
ncbi:MAG: hypothetical protein M3063_04720 [Actinomycetota bacterium]|nr:hypothetical protein [Actinomycetota bacterium]